MLCSRSGGRVETRARRQAARSGGGMHIDPYIVLASAVVGVLVGMTGAGGGALMTPMLILLFGVKPSSAISSDLVAAVMMRPVGAAVHFRKGTVHRGLVGWMVLGSVPMAFLGAYLLHVIGGARSAQTNIERLLGVALLAGAAAMVLRYYLDSREGQGRVSHIHDVIAKPLPTLAIGMIGGVIVGMTSVGAGSLMIILLLFLYPMISAKQLVGTDLSQAVPLTLAAAVGALVFGHVEFGVTTSLILGSVPAVLVGSAFSSSAPDRYIRPVITFVIFASGLKYVGIGSTELGWILVTTLLVSFGAWSWHQAALESDSGCCPRPAPTADLSPRQTVSAGSSSPGIEQWRLGNGPSAPHLERVLTPRPEAIDREVVVEARGAQYAETLHDRKARAVHNREVLVGEGLTDPPCGVEVAG